jgi:hypothetical protein
MNHCATVVAIKPVMNRFMPSTSMTLLHPKSENGLPLRWLTFMGSSTSMCAPSRVGTPWTRTGCTWTTARSSTSARNTSPALNPLTPELSAAQSTRFPENNIRHPKGMVVSVLRGVAPSIAQTLGHSGGGGADGRTHRHHAPNESAPNVCSYGWRELSSISWWLGRPHVPDAAFSPNRLPPVSRGSGYAKRGSPTEAIVVTPTRPWALEAVVGVEPLE